MQPNKSYICAPWVPQTTPAPRRRNTHTATRSPRGARCSGSGCWNRTSQSDLTHAISGSLRRVANWRDREIHKVGGEMRAGWCGREAWERLRVNSLRWTATVRLLAPRCEGFHRSGESGSLQSCVPRVPVRERVRVLLLLLLLPCAHPSHPASYASYADSDALILKTCFLPVVRRTWKAVGILQLCTHSCFLTHGMWWEVRKISTIAS